MGILGLFLSFKLLTPSIPSFFKKKNCGFFYSKSFSAWCFKKKKKNLFLKNLFLPFLLLPQSPLSGPRRDAISAAHRCRLRFCNSLFFPFTFTGPAGKENKKKKKTKKKKLVRSWHFSAASLIFSIFEKKTKWSFFFFGFCLLGFCLSAAADS